MWICNGKDGTLPDHPVESRFKFCPDDGNEQPFHLSEVEELRAEVLHLQTLLAATPVAPSARSAEVVEPVAEPVAIVEPVAEPVAAALPPYEPVRPAAVPVPHESTFSKVGRWWNSK